MQMRGLLGLDLIETGDDAISDITSSLIVPGAGVNIVSGSETFVGAIGDGTDSNTAQSGIFSGVNNPPTTSVDEPFSAILLLSGIGVMLGFRRRH